MFDRRAVLQHACNVLNCGRRAAAVLLLISLHASQAVLCAGWSGSAADRMACCARTSSTCGGVSADDCCADGEQRQNVEGAHSVILVPPTAIACAVPVPAPGWHRISSHSSFHTNRPSAYLLDSVFRI